MENIVGDISVHPAVDIPQNTLFHSGITQVPTDQASLDRVRNVFQDCYEKHFDKLFFAERDPHPLAPTWHRTEASPVPSPRRRPRSEQHPRLVHPSGHVGQVGGVAMVLYTLRPYHKIPSPAGYTSTGVGFSDGIGGVGVSENA